MKISINLDKFRKFATLFYLTFGDEVVASAILDRLLHHSYPFLINGPSYRMKELFKKKQQKTEQGSEIPIPEDENI